MDNKIIFITNWVQLTASAVSDRRFQRWNIQFASDAPRSLPCHYQEGRLPFPASPRGHYGMRKPRFDPRRSTSFVFSRRENTPYKSGLTPVRAPTIWTIFQTKSPPSHVTQLNDFLWLFFVVFFQRGCFCCQQTSSFFLSHDWGRKQSRSVWCKNSLRTDHTSSTIKQCKTLNFFPLINKISWYMGNNGIYGRKKKFKQFLRRMDVIYQNKTLPSAKLWRWWAVTFKAWSHNNY